MKPDIAPSDGFGYYSYIVSFSEDNDFVLNNQYEIFRATNNVTPLSISSVTNNVYNPYQIGTSLLWFPFYKTADLINNIFELNHSPYDTSSIYVTFVCYGTGIYVFIGLYLIFLILKEHSNTKLALALTLTIWLATPLFFYTYFQPSVSHGISMFTTALFYYLWMKFKDNITHGKALILTISAFGMIIIRPQNVFYTIPFIYFEIKKLIIRLTNKKTQFEIKKNHLISFLVKYVSCFLLFILLYTPQFILWNFYHGDYLSGPSPKYNTESLNIFKPVHLTKFFFSPQHGVFYWHPIYIFAFLGLFIGITAILLNKNKIKKSISKKNKLFSELPLILLCPVILQTLLLSSWDFWFSAQSFGQRKFMATTFIFAYGLFIFYDKITKVKKHNKIIKYSFWTIVILLIIYNFLLMILYGSRIISAEGPVTYAEVFYHIFNTLPNKIIDILKNFISL